MPSHPTRSLLKYSLPPLLSILLVVMPVLADDALPQAAQQQQESSAAPQSAQPQAPLQPAPLPTVEGLKVIPLAGKDESNDVARKVMAPLVVEILDQNDRPVEGAEVVFRFPLQGPGAAFPGGRTSQTVRSNGQGEAAATGWMANSQEGRFDVHVSASYGNQIGQTTVSMVNATKVARTTSTVLGPGSEKHGNWLSPTWVKVAVAAGGAALVVGILLATRGGSKSSQPTITISPGTPSVGGPH
ncbi:MAG TPA: hypothetical protein VKX49_24755 [Bryobacteraceae bacterium]|nr:hypothetical protein [Bryobacteraceae bacterium]